MNGQYTPLFLAVSIPTVIGVIGLILNRSDFNAIRRELSDIRERLAAIETDMGYIRNILGIPSPKPAPARKA